MKKILMIVCVLSLGFMQTHAQMEAYTGTPKEIHSTYFEATGAANVFDISGFVYFDYGTDSNYLNQMSAITSLSGFTLTPVQTTISGLTCNTLYYYRIHVNNSMSDTTGNIVSFTTSQATGLNETSPSVNLATYPNPAQDVLNITVKSPGITYCEIHNIAGQKVIDATITNGIGIVDVSTLKNGIYLILTQNESGISAQKFSVSK